MQLLMLQEQDNHHHRSPHSLQIFNFELPLRDIVFSILELETSSFSLPFYPS